MSTTACLFSIHQVLYVITSITSLCWHLPPVRALAENHYNSYFPRCSRVRAPSAICVMSPGGPVSSLHRPPRWLAQRPPHASELLFFSLIHGRLKLFEFVPSRRNFLATLSAAPNLFSVSEKLLPRLVSFTRSHHFNNATLRVIIVIALPYFPPSFLGEAYSGFSGSSVNALTYKASTKLLNVK